jgi:hypothetical protein
MVLYSVEPSMGQEVERIHLSHEWQANRDES